ncbi:MAG TPA: ABC-F family ATP-binding cassette domain-containing protein [Rhizomicrobium sp.]
MPLSLITLDNISARKPDGGALFENLNLSFGRERTALVGRNGAGKTTLLKIIAAVRPPSEGAVTRHGSVGLLRQHLEAGAGDTVAQCLGASEQLAIQARVLAGSGTDGDLARADWTLETRLAEALGDVGLGGLDLPRGVLSLSGGERTRLALARLLLAAPDVLLLDEPTNNLDAAGRAAVIAVLERWKGGAIVASHDRALLRRMDRVIELSALGAKLYGGNYDLYAERKTAERAGAARELDSAERESDRVHRALQKEKEKKARRDSEGKKSRAKGDAPKLAMDFKAERAEGSAGRQSHLASRLKVEAAEALEAAREKVERVRMLALDLPSTGLSSRKLVLKLDNAAWTAPAGRAIVAPLSLSIVGPERIAVTGPNGAGKTTLLRLMAGEIAPSLGSVLRPAKSALLDQHAAIFLPCETLLDAFLRFNPASTLNAAHAALATFLFRNEAAHRDPQSLSGGEKLRAALAVVLGGSDPPQLLLLDEPTNHLDLDSIAAIEGALKGYDGALVVVSHDEDFLAAIGIERRINLSSSGSR